MSGPKKDKVILSEQGVVTEQALTAYLQNKLSPEEKQQLEKLLLEDPFAQDALEGLQSSLNQTAVQTAISSLNKKVRERSGLKEHKRVKMHWVTYAWAAVVFGLLIGIGFIMVNFLDKKDTNLAVNNNKENTEAPVMQPNDTDAVSARPANITIDSSVRTGTVSDTIAVTIASGASVSKPVPNDAKALKDNKPATPATAKLTQSAMSQTTATSTNQKVAEGVTVVKNKADSLVSAYKGSGPLGAQPKDVGALQDDAMKNFNLGDYNTAADDFDNILKREPDNPDALYFGGISDYINGKTAKSENNFDKLLKKGSKYAEGSKWYKALILIKKGHSDAAKPLLQDLSNSNGSYKERAIKKLAEMGF